MTGAFLEGLGSVLASSAGKALVRQTVGRAAGAAAAAAAGVSAGWLAAIGIVIMGLGYGLQALGSVVEKWTQMRDDPLARWLPLHSPWAVPLSHLWPVMRWPAEDRATTEAERGRFPDQRRRLLEAVRPDGDVGLVQASGAGADREVAPILEGTTAALLGGRVRVPGLGVRPAGGGHGRRPARARRRAPVRPDRGDPRALGDRERARAS